MMSQQLESNKEDKNPPVLLDADAQGEKIVECKQVIMDCVRKLSETKDANQLRHWYIIINGLLNVLDHLCFNIVTEDELKALTRNRIKANHRG